MLNHSFYKFYPARLQRDGSYYAAGSGDFSQKKTLSLVAGASQELYYGSDVNMTSPPDKPGAGWTESMSGDCSCTIR